MPGYQSINTVGGDWPRWLARDLRSNEAGETGAVAIYDGILAVARDSAVREFARAHRSTEQEHLALIRGALPSRNRSRLAPLWRAAGWLIGALPALFGPSAVFATVDAVETFVDRHYGSQIERMAASGIDPGLRRLLEQCRADEIAHRDDARGRLTGRTATVWRWFIAGVSAFGVAIARRV